MSQKTDIPVKIIKKNTDIVSYFVHHSFDNQLSCSTFLIGTKYAEVTPIYKKDDRTKKKRLPPDKYFV